MVGAQGRKRRVDPVDHVIVAVASEEFSLLLDDDDDALLLVLVEVNVCPPLLLQSLLLKCPRFKHGLLRALEMSAVPLPLQLVQSLLLLLLLVLVQELGHLRQVAHARGEEAAVAFAISRDVDEGGEEPVRLWWGLGGRNQAVHGDGGLRWLVAGKECFFRKSKGEVKR